MEYVVDVQGFKLPENKFILKELAILPVLDKQIKPYSFSFKPPYSWENVSIKYKSINYWLERNHHDISWDSGIFEHCSIPAILYCMLKDASKIYVKGDDKKKWLETYLDASTEIVDLVDIDCPSLRKLYEMSGIIECNHHNSRVNFSCAVINVNLLRKWLCLHFT